MGKVLIWFVIIISTVVLYCLMVMKDKAESDPQYTMSQEDLKVLEQETDAKGSSVCIKC